MPAAQATSPLVQCVVGIEEQVAATGWDQPARLYALVEARALAEAEPTLATQLGVQPAGTGYVPIEQEPLDQHRDLADVLAGVGWPDTVHGCAVAVERLVLPPSVEAELLLDDGAVAAAQRHPDRRELRLVVGVLRSGERSGAIRVRGDASEERLVLARDAAPALADALLATLLT